MLAVDRAQRVQQVIHVEADFDIFATIGDLELLFGLLLLGIVRLNNDPAVADNQANATIFLIRQNCCALQRAAQ